jgi:hypothetical protein
MRSIVFVLVTLVACDSSSKTEEFCKRADSCNILNGSVDECVEELDVWLADMPPSKRDEVMYDVQLCLDRPSCGGFADCVEDLDYKVAPATSTPNLDQADWRAE